MPAALLLLGILSAGVQADADFDKKIEEILAKRQTPGSSIAFSESGSVKFAKGYGLANVEHKVPMKPESVHELASVSKQFTAAAILQLAEKKKLSLDDPISKFFEGAHEDWKKVTVRHLLEHTGGLPDYLMAVGDPAKHVNESTMVDSIKDKKLLFEPGSKWQYSNSGYMLLGLIIQKVSEQSMGDYLKEHIFDPAGMKSAALNDTTAVIPNRADGYSIRGGKIVREGFTSPSLCRTGDGQVMASALDLLAWDSALRSGKVLSSASQKLMEQASKASNGQYGLGVGLLNGGGKVVQHHGGGWMGTSTFLVRYVGEGKCLVILCNSDSAATGELLAACEEKFLGKKVVSAPRA